MLHGYFYMQESKRPNFYFFIQSAVLLLLQKKGILHFEKPQSSPHSPTLAALAPTNHTPEITDTEVPALKLLRKMLTEMLLHRRPYKDH